MEKIKKLIIGLVIICIIILILILVISKQSKPNEQEEPEVEIHESDISEDFIKEMDVVEDYRTFFSVEKMLNNYIKEAYNKNEEVVYSLLDSQYIQENTITKANVLNKLIDYSKYNSEAIIRKMYEQTNEKNAIYYIKCIFEKQENEFYFILCKDELNFTYSVKPINKETFEKETQNANQELARKEIEKNDYNTAINVNPTEREIIITYFEHLLENALNYPEYLYDCLTEEYKNKSFATLQEFKDYIETKREIFETYGTGKLKKYDEFETWDDYLDYLAKVKKLDIDQYQIREENEGNRYIIVDNMGNYYTIYATTPFNYTLVLGNYVIPTEDFMQDYENSNDAEKALLNIKRFFMGIDDKNYGYSYSVLSEAFKNNKYPSKEEFVNYAKQNFFEENEIKNVSYEIENGLYVYEITLADAKRPNSEGKILNVIVKLNEGTDFEMSFGE